MYNFQRLLSALLLLAVSTGTLAQAEPGEDADDAEKLKMTAVEALIMAPPEKALPIASRVLEGDGSVELKERALFILSQIDLPEARNLLAETARSGDGPLRSEAIRMIGIQGDSAALGMLAELYSSGDGDIRAAILEAYVIAGEEDAVYRIATEAQDAREFEKAVQALGAMGALDQLRALSSRTDMSESLIQAYAIAGDTSTLLELARDASEPRRQVQAIHGLAVAGGDGVGDTLVDIYRNTRSSQVKEAVRQGLLIMDDDEAVVALFRASQDSDEKRTLLGTLVQMDSDEVWDLIDSTLENGP